LEQRHKAMEALELAAHLAPRDTAVLSRLARAYLDAGFSHDAKETYEHIVTLAPDGADGYEGLGRVWKRDWLAPLATAPFQKSLPHFDDAARRDRARAEVGTLLALVPLER